MVGGNDGRGPIPHACNIPIRKRISPSIRPINETLRLSPIELSTESAPMRLPCRLIPLSAALILATSAHSADDPKVELAKKAQAVLKANCYKCHGEAGAVEGGMNYIVDLERLVA